MKVRHVHDAKGVVGFWRIATGLVAFEHAAGGYILE